jgi:hypothetical protein
MDSIIVIAYPLPLLLAAQVQFEKDVLPIFTKYCLQCHGATTKMGGLDLRTPSGMLKGGPKGPALLKGSAERSLLYQRIVDKSMPMGELKVSNPEARVIRDWINGGAVADQSHHVIAEPRGKQQHWAFRPLGSSQPPKVNNVAGVRTPVDAIML